MTNTNRTNQTIDPKTAETFRAFWESFSRSPLYVTGIAEPVEACHADRVDTWADLVQASTALGYITGYAQASRLANAYQSPRWHICHLAAIAAGIQLTLLAGEDPTGRNRQASNLCEVWTAELAALAARL